MLKWILITGLCLNFATICYANKNLGKQLYESQCIMCHGQDARATGPLANKSNPPTPDLTSVAFRKRLSDFPGTIVAAVVLRPNLQLITSTLKNNNVKIKPHTWTTDDLRALNQYMLKLIQKNSRE